uniref:RING-type domain-containing protein n=1 Tax=Myripristis murdjan TaxID=586833 RepID=A0A668AWE3_9TELE
MASAGSSLSNSEFTCSICLDFFREPVSTPCGHNFCQSCITNCWDSRDISQCPLCMTEFHRRPELQVNTGFREVVEHFKRMRAQGSDDSLAKADEVACDVCEETKCKAVKSCLVCLVSLCQIHLEPHQRVSALKRHKLISPVGNLEDWMCKEHDKVVEFFCRRDQKFVCTSCMKDVHATHETVALEEECALRKDRLHMMDTEMKRKLNVKCLKVQQVKNSKVQGQGDTEKAKVDITKAFSALVASVESYKTMLVELLEEKQRAAEQQADDVIKHLNLQIAELQKRSAELEEVSKTEDPLQLLQSPPPVFPLLHTEGWPPLRHHSLQHVETVRSTVAKLEEAFRLEMDRVICDISQADDGKETAKNADSSEMEGLHCSILKKSVSVWTCLRSKPHLRNLWGKCPFKNCPFHWILAQNNLKCSLFHHLGKATLFLGSLPVVM